MLSDNQFGDAGHRVVVEEFLRGEEASFIVMVDGTDILPLASSQDHKAAYDGDQGPNTGGMGAVSPIPFADAAFLTKVEERIVKPTIAGLKKEGIGYKGFLFIGLMNTQGDPYVIEYNVRMGDPETEAVLPRIESDFVDLLVGIAEGDLANYTLKISPKTCTTVVMVSGGYPESYAKGFPIIIPEKTINSVVFHAGTSQDKSGILTNQGGRVLAITGVAATLEEALASTYATVAEITWEKAYFRKDIGQDILRLKK